MNRPLLFIIAACVASASLQAAQLTPAQALQRAGASPGNVRILSTSSQSALQLLYTATHEGMNTLYVFGSPQGGFAILPADDAVNATVLGYSDTAAFDAATMPDNLRWWLGQYSQEIAMTASRPQAVLSDPGTGPVGYPDIEPLVTARWNQEAPYNLLTPMVSGEHCPTGCVATAMAQVMKKWGYPEHGIGSKTYVASYITHEEVTVDFANTTYDWGAMLDTYDANSPEESKQAVATLMLSCGVASSMSYAPNASGTNYTVASEAMVNYFGYDKALRDLNRNYFGIEEWTSMIYTELSEGRPVLYGGQNDQGGHAFVIDGYRTDGYFHLNWGWGGVSNGYFLVTALNPGEQGVGGSSGGYNLDQAMVLGIRPPVEGSQVIPVVEFMSEFTIADSIYNRASASTVEVYDIRGIFNMSVVGLDLVFGLKLTDGQGNVSYIEAPQSNYLQRGGGLRSYTVAVADFPASGTYKVHPAVRPADSDAWTDALVAIDYRRDYTLTATDSRLVFVPEGEAKLTQTGLTLLTPLYPGHQFALSANLVNKSQEEYYQAVTPVLLRNHSEVGRAEPIAVELEAGQSDRFEWVGEFSSSLSPGTYTLCLVDVANKVIGPGIEVTVKKVPTEEADPFFLSVVINGNEAVSSTESTPAYSNLPEWEAVVTVGNKAGYFNDLVNGGVWYSDHIGLEEIPGSFVGIDPGQTAKVTLTHDFSSLEPDHVYQLRIFGHKKGYFGPHFYFKADPASGISMVDTPDRISLFTDGITEAHVAGPAEIALLTLYDINGRTVATVEGPSVDLGRLTAGVYLLRATDVRGNSATFRLLRH